MAGAVVATLGGGGVPSGSGTASTQASSSSTETGAITPIQHVVVLFQENVSFDHYFGTYPDAANTDGSHFPARADTPTVNGLSRALLLRNPSGANPSRLSHSQPLTRDQNHDTSPAAVQSDDGGPHRSGQAPVRRVAVLLVAEQWRPAGGGSFDAYAGTLDHMFDFDDGARNIQLILDPATGEPEHN